MKPSQIFCFCHSVPRYFKADHTKVSASLPQLLCLNPVYFTYLFSATHLSHKKCFHSCHGPTAGVFSFLSMSDIFVFAAGLEHHCLHVSASTWGLKAVLRKLFPIHSSPLLFAIFLYSGGQFGYIFSFLCCWSAPLSAQASRHKAVNNPSMDQSQAAVQSPPWASITIGPASSLKPQRQSKASSGME